MLLKKWISILLAAGCLTGCSGQTIVNKINLVQTIGLDSMEQGVKCTALIGNFKKKGESNVQFLSTTAESTYDIMPSLNAKTKNRIEYGQLGVALFGQSYAEQGIAPILETFCRSPKISSSMQLGVTDTTASLLLAKARQTQDSYFLCDMIDQHINYGNLPRINLQETMFQYFGEGRDLYLPHLSLEGEDIRIDGLALFRDDRYVTTIGMKQAFLLKLLIQDTKKGNFIVPIPGSSRKDENVIQFESSGSKSVYRLNGGRPVPSVTIDVSLRAQARQYPARIDFSSSEQTSKLETNIIAYLEEELRQLLAFCQKNEVDPVGIGDFVRSKSKDWNEKQFRALYPKTDLKVQVHFTIVEPVITQ